MDRLLTLDEVKQLQIEMLKEFDKFCRTNNITYFLSYGTLLGAIRHKGYIPWDDDVDVMVPRDQINRLKSIFKSERYKIADVDNEPNYEFPYPRLIDTRTYKKIGKRAKSHGVNIDIYPIDAIEEDSEKRKIFRNHIQSIQIKRRFLLRLRNKLFRIFPISKFPFIKYYTRKVEAALNSLDYSTHDFVHVCDSKNEPMPKKWFEKSVEVEFDGLNFPAPAEWHNILTSFYGNYMQLPPEDQRHAYHGSNHLYVKDCRS